MWMAGHVTLPISDPVNTVTLTVATQTRLRILARRYVGHQGPAGRQSIFRSSMWADDYIRGRCADSCNSDVIVIVVGTDNHH